MNVTNDETNLKSDPAVPEARLDHAEAAAERLPVVVRPQPALTTVRRWRRWPLLLVFAAGLIGFGTWWWTHRPPELPPGIAWSNGRLEADEIDIATKLPGRVAEVLVDEGTMVKAGQVVARMDTRDLEASLAQARAQITQAEHMAASAKADLDQQHSQVVLAGQELQRARALVPGGFETREVLDQRQSQLDAATSAYASTEARMNASAAALDAARHSADLIGVNIADNTLVAPKDGPIQYRLANVGEVLGAGGKVFTMLDVSNVYMDIFLPTAQAGRSVLGAEGRIALDAVPGVVIPAKVTFVAAQNQFTPKTVETRTERDKLMFRVRVRIDPDRLRAHADQVRSGLPGLAYVRTDPNTPWPDSLRVRPAE
jgi:HlyD family secretion protein